MEHHKMYKLLKESTISKFLTIKWIKVNNLTDGQYSVAKSIRLTIPTSRSNLCDYNDVYIVVKGTLNIAVDGNNSTTQGSVALHLGHGY